MAALNANSSNIQALNENNYFVDAPKSKDVSDDTQCTAAKGCFRRTCAAVFILAVLAAAVKAISIRRTMEPRAARVDIEFERFARKYGKEYTSQDEMMVRRAIFGANLAIIEAANARGNSYTLAVNEFADLTSEEFQASHLGFGSAGTPSRHWSGLPNLGLSEGNSSNRTLPDAIDWVAKGAVTPVKNQGQCGSCWSFSTVASLEGAWQIVSGKLVSLSEQQFVDCSKGNSGCGGGSMDAAFEDMMGKAICSEEAYTYKGKAGVCNVTGCERGGLPKGALVGYKDVAPDDEQALMEAVATQPVSVAIEADQLSIQLYSGGVLTKKCGDSVNHAVLVVGYGTENGVNYWKVKNSWGSSWGEGGYVRIERGLKGAGECGINSMASYPVLKQPNLEELIEV